MTSVAGLIIAVIAGCTVRGSRRAVAAVVPPWLAVLAMQTWTLGTGQANNPANTISDGAYPIVQVMILALALGVAGSISNWRTRREARSDLPTSGRAERTSARWRASIWTAFSTAATAAASLAYVVVLNPVAPSARQAGSGQPPLYAIVSFVACMAIIIVFSVAAARARHVESRGSFRPSAATGSRTPT